MDLPGERITYCNICFKNSDDCICPECPKCGEFGDPACYAVRGKRNRGKRHGLKLNKAQLVARQEILLRRLGQKIHEAEYDLKAMEGMEDPFAPINPDDPFETHFSPFLHEQEDPTAIRTMWE
jgi:hypothetical protein